MIDSDCDGVLTDEDCDDSDPDDLAEDADCDTVSTDEDCDDNDSTIGLRSAIKIVMGSQRMQTVMTTTLILTVSIDQDCDGTETDADCDNDQTYRIDGI